MKKLFLFTSIILLFGIAIGQIPARKSGKENFYIGISGISSNNLLSYSIADTNYNIIESTPTINFGGAVEIGYYFNSMVGVSAGVWLNKYGKEFLINNETGKYVNITDNESDKYNLKVDIESFVEKQTITYMEIPIGMHIRIPVEKNVFFCLTPNMSIAVPVYGRSNIRSDISYTGHYSKYNITFSDDDLIPYGFGHFPSQEYESKLNVHNILTCIGLKAAVDFEYWNNMSVSMGILYNQGVVLKKEDEPKASALTTSPEKVNSISNTASSWKLRSFGGFIRGSFFLFR